VVTESDKVQAANANIKSVGINNSELTKVENKEYQYEATLPEGTTEAAIDIETENEYSTVKVEKIDSLVYNETRSNIKRLSTKKIVELNPGDNYFKVTVTSEDKTVTNEFKIKVKVQRPEVVLRDDILTANALITTAPRLTTSSAISGDASGLYSATDTNSGNVTYYFRGAVENNYVSFAGQTWRIVRVNEDGTIRIVMQDGINDNTTYKFNTEAENVKYMYYTNSEAKTLLDNWYDTNIGSNSDYSKYVVSGDYYCEQAKAAYNTNYASESGTSMKPFKNYAVNFKCESDENGYGIVNSNIGLLSYDEMVHAGGYLNQTNKNYYLYNHKGFWTMGPAGHGFSKSIVWTNYSNGKFYLNNVSDSYTLRPVINIKSDTMVSGTGTISDPYVIQ
ncbi:MAG: cadherin-like beta sandwich domain-containing protein, partial [Tenericutes bacterium]|nr:cadherin-like beta sandwich domain-containing protein [Mycoplasmatota bacterium]